jgi:hypothetical protein
VGAGVSLRVYGTHRERRVLGKQTTRTFNGATTADVDVSDHLAVDARADGRGLGDVVAVEEAILWKHVEERPRHAEATRALLHSGHLVDEVFLVNE